jgi:hypothetical protein
MIVCGTCKQWFHRVCVGLNETVEQNADGGDVYYCSTCSAAALRQVVAAEEVISNDNRTERECDTEHFTCDIV